MIKKLMWLIKNQEEIEKIINEKIEEKPQKQEKKDEDKGYSIAGVPEFQKNYVNDLLSGKLKDN